MSNFRERFETEVERIGGVTAISNNLGVARNTIYNWMAKGNAPLNSLMALQGVLGMDVMYVVTGERGASALSGDEAAMLERFRTAPKAVQKAVTAALNAEEAPKPKKSKQTFNGPVGQAVGGDITNHKPVVFNVGRDTAKE
ncbi:helix-turn-helix domain-containing protein [Pseudomonas sp. NPDC096950]|uniref:helix-turn-helix domain-containing protein n=1 Tax=Pseudomonas sp. NPDC096950 TaxID=3364485 RepID=UPI00383AE80C